MALGTVLFIVEEIPVPVSIQIPSGYHVSLLIETIPGILPVPLQNDPGIGRPCTVRILIPPASRILDPAASGPIGFGFSASASSMAFRNQLLVRKGHGKAAQVPGLHRNITAVPASGNGILAHAFTLMLHVGIPFLY